jgi:hypothetical protein
LIRTSIADMIYDASTPALPRKGRSVQHAFFTDERIA